MDGSGRGFKQEHHALEASKLRFQTSYLRKSNYIVINQTSSYKLMCYKEYNIPNTFDKCGLSKKTDTLLGLLYSHPQPIGAMKQKSTTKAGIA